MIITTYQYEYPQSRIQRISFNQGIINGSLFNSKVIWCIPIEISPWLHPVSTLSPSTFSPNINNFISPSPPSITYSNPLHNASSLRGFGRFDVGENYKRTCSKKKSIRQIVTISITFGVRLVIHLANNHKRIGNTDHPTFQVSTK
ncbi:hypothetical protein ACTFIU_011428 [Dictyostelium citrinum]